jgi:hypothetical protein
LCWLYLIGVTIADKLNRKVWPLESFEEGAEFMETLAKAFEHAHGYSFKTAFAETLVHLLHPVAKVCNNFCLHDRTLKFDRLHKRR